MKLVNATKQGAVGNFDEFPAVAFFYASRGFMSDNQASLCRVFEIVPPESRRPEMNDRAGQSCGKHPVVGKDVETERSGTASARALVAPVVGRAVDVTAAQTAQIL